MNPTQSILFAILMICASISYGQQFYFSTDANGAIYKCSIYCDMEFIGNTNFYLTDIAQCPDGKLYGITQGDFYEIDTSDATATLIGSNPISLNALVSNDSGNIYAAGMNNIYQINKTTGAATLIGTSVYNSAGDLAFFNDTLYLAAEYSSLIRIQLAPTFSAQFIGSFNLPHFVWGLATVESFTSGQTKTMIVTQTNQNIDSSYVFAVDRHTADTSKLCETGFAISSNYKITGAASRHHPHFSNIADKNNPDNTFVITPNPFSFSTLLKTDKDLNDACFVVRDVTGQIVKKTCGLNGREIEIYRDNLPSGIYFLQIVDDKKVSLTKKIMII